MIGALARAFRALRTPVALAADPKRPSTRSGEVASGWPVLGGIPEVDYLDELAWPEYIDEFRKVANDPQVAKELRSATYPLLQADWRVEPATDDTRDELIADFIEANFYQATSETFGRDFWMRTPWPSRLRDILRMLPYGFAVFHRTYRTQGRFIVIDGMKYLQPQSIRRWYFDEADHLIEINRYFIGANGEPVSGERIPASELVIYTWDQEGSNILGRPLIRPMWKPFQFKSRFEKLSVINKQKTAIGVPYFFTRDGDSPEDEARAEQVAKQMRAGNLERLYVKGKIGQEFGWKEGGDSTKGFPELINNQNTEIAKAGGAGLVQELGIQASSGGSRGVAGAQILAGTQLPQAISVFVCLVENQLIAEQVDLNFPGRIAPPTVKAKGIDPFEKTRNMPEVVAAIQGKVLTNTLDTENEVRTSYGLMEITEEERAAAQPQPVEPGTQGDPNAPGGDPSANRGGKKPKLPPGTDAGDAAALGPGDKLEPVPTPSGLDRRGAAPLTAGAADGVEETESHIGRARVDAEAIRGELERWEASYLRTLSLVQRDMRDAAIEQIRNGKVPRKADDIKVPYQDDLRERLVTILKSVRDFGRDSVSGEVNRQLVGLKKAPAVPDPTTRRGAIAYSNSQAEVTAGLDVSNLVQRLQGQVVSQYNDLAGTGATPEAIAGNLSDYLAGLSAAQIESMARASTASVFNAGRNVTILELATQLEPMAVRVEVLDNNTCDPCAALDGMAFKIGTPAYLENQPPRQCDGMQRCRGFYVVRAKP
jgi:hypothetical protein